MTAIELVLATNNIHKLTEIRKTLPLSFNLLTLKDAGVLFELPETSGTIPGNAMQKARVTFESTGKNCLADDSGLLVEVLDNQPGVDSAFYAGLPRNDQRNIEKLLENLIGKTNRKARFITVLALILDGKEYLFEGEIKGEIALSPSGNAGFGYDPVFVPVGYQHTFADMDPDLKNKISHRANAIQKMMDFFSNFKA
jgi:XTP/dITP diphosphohydrolase